jgi:hypothetical protein
MKLQCSLVDLSKKVHIGKSRMNSKLKKSLTKRFSACCVLLMITAGHADTFVPPTGKISPFRRDQLPITDRAIRHLSEQLENVSSASPYETAEHRRAVSKALALALALEPSNESAERTLQRLIDGERPNALDPGKIEAEKKQAWNSIAWLSSAEAGEDGNVLAALLGDALANLFPTDPQSNSYLSKPEHAGWNGWVPELAIFKKDPIKKEEPKIDEPKEEDKPEVVVVTPTKVLPKYDPAKGVVMNGAKILTVLRMYDNEKAMWTHKVVPLRMSGTNDPYNHDGEKQYGFSVKVAANSDEYWQMQEEISRPLKDRLTGLLGRMPERAEVNVSIDSEQPTYPYNRNRGAITGPAFVLAHAALTGIAPDGIVIGEIDKSGKLKLPPYFWRALMTLAEGSGGRLILPASAEPAFINLLALEKPDFFFKYEVLIASSVEEFVALSSKEPSDKHLEIYNKFKVIKEKSAGATMGTYLTNKFVRERLQEIVGQVPYHLSAKVLLIYGSVSRPRYLTREALAGEIWRKIDVISELAKIHDYYGINANQLTRMEELYNKMRDDMRDLERYTDSKNSDLLKEAKDVVTSVRTFGRAFEGKGEMWEKQDKIESMHDDMKDANRELIKKLAELTGDPLPKSN